MAEMVCLQFDSLGLFEECMPIHGGKLVEIPHGYDGYFDKRGMISCLLDFSQSDMNMQS